MHYPETVKSKWWQSENQMGRQQKGSGPGLLFRSWSTHSNDLPVTGAYFTISNIANFCSHNHKFKMMKMYTGGFAVLCVFCQTCLLKLLITSLQLGTLRSNWGDFEGGGGDLFDKRDVTVWWSWAKPLEWKHVSHTPALKSAFCFLAFPPLQPTRCMFDLWINVSIKTFKLTYDF